MRYDEVVMVNMERIQLAVEVLVGLGARKIILFGSAAEDPQTAHDIDLAVSGIPSEHMLDADVKIGDVLQQPFDLVSETDNKAFFEIITRYGKVLYG
jgi:predicted nucleotidyltransferase